MATIDKINDPASAAAGQISPWQGCQLDSPDWYTRRQGFLYGIDDRGACRKIAATPDAAEESRLTAGQMLDELEPDAAYPSVPGTCRLTEWLPIVRAARIPVEFSTLWRDAHCAVRLFRCRAGRLNTAADDGSTIFVIAQGFPPGYARIRALQRTARSNAYRFQEVDLTTAPSVVETARRLGHDLNNLLTVARCASDMLDSVAAGTAAKHRDNLRWLLQGIAEQGDNLRRACQEAQVAGEYSPAGRARLVNVHNPSHVNR